MQKHLRKIILISALFFSASTLAQENTLPPLPTEGFVSGRIATQEDVKSGNAAFAPLPEQRVMRRAVPLPIPQYALYTADGNQKIVFIIQVEKVNGAITIGARYPEGGEVIGTPKDFQMLGVNPTGAP
jgi:hypothetical protein